MSKSHVKIEGDIISFIGYGNNKLMKFWVDEVNVIQIFCCYSSSSCLIIIVIIIIRIIMITIVVDVVIITITTTINFILVMLLLLVLSFIVFFFFFLRCYVNTCSVLPICFPPGITSTTN